MAADSKPLLRLETSADFGRFLVADEDIPPLTIISVEAPMVIGAAEDPQESVPEDETCEAEGPPVYCCGCFAKIISREMAFCQDCRWPVCNLSCSVSPIHHDNECQLFSLNKIPFNPTAFQSLQRSLLVLRCILLESKNPRHWSTLMGMEDHNSVRHSKAHCVQQDTQVIASVTTFLGLSQLSLRTEALVKKICGILDVNAFTFVKSKSRIVQGVYGTSSLFSHSCIPNCTWSMGPGPDYSLIVRSNTAISAGSMITFAYSDKENLCGTLHRLVSAEDVAHFTCKCSRCQDPTESNTFLSAIKCPKCPKGYVLPANPTDLESQWFCSYSEVYSEGHSEVSEDSSKTPLLKPEGGCSQALPVTKIVPKLCNIEKQLDAVKRQEDIEIALKKLSHLIMYCKTQLFGGHYLVLKCKMARMKLLQASGRLEVLDQVVRDCRDVLAVMDSVSPGFSNKRMKMKQFLVSTLKEYKGPDSKEMSSEINSLEAEISQYFLFLRSLS